MVILEIKGLEQGLTNASKGVKKLEEFWSGPFQDGSLSELWNAGLHRLGDPPE
jgi:hypothetical protein